MISTLFVIPSIPADSLNDHKMQKRLQTCFIMFRQNKSWHFPVQPKKWFQGCAIKITQRCIILMLSLPKKNCSGITVQLAVYSLRVSQSSLESKCTSLAALSCPVFLRKQLTFLVPGVKQQRDKARIYWEFDLNRRIFYLPVKTLTICISFFSPFFGFFCVCVCARVEESRGVCRFFSKRHLFFSSLCLVHKEMWNMPPSLWLLSFVKVTFI